MSSEVVSGSSDSVGSDQHGQKMEQSNSAIDDGVSVATRTAIGVVGSTVDSVSANVATGQCNYEHAQAVFEAAKGIENALRHHHVQQQSSADEIPVLGNKDRKQLKALVEQLSTLVITPLLLDDVAVEIEPSSNSIPQAQLTRAIDGLKAAAKTRGRSVPGELFAILEWCTNAITHSPRTELNEQLVRICLTSIASGLLQLEALHPVLGPRASPILSRLLESIDPYLCLQVLLTVITRTPTHKPPLWLQRAAGRRLAAQLTGYNGLRVFIEYLADGDKHVTPSMLQVDAATRLLLAAPSSEHSTPDAYFTGIANQLIANMVQKDEHYIAYTATLLMRNMLAAEHPLAHSILIKKLTWPFALWSQVAEEISVSESDFDASIDCLSALFVRQSTVAKIHQAVISPIFHPLVVLYFTMSESAVCRVTEPVRAIIMAHLEALPAVDAASAVKSLITGLTSEPVRVYCLGSTGGVCYKPSDVIPTGYPLCSDSDIAKLMRILVKPLDSSTSSNSSNSSNNNNKKIELDDVNMEPGAPTGTCADYVGELFTQLLFEYAALKELVSTEDVSSGTRHQRLTIVLQFIMEIMNQLGVSVLKNTHQMIAFAIDVIERFISSCKQRLEIISEQQQQQQQHQMGQKKSAIDSLMNSAANLSISSNNDTALPELDIQNLLFALSLVDALLSKYDKRFSVDTDSDNDDDDLDDEEDEDVNESDIQTDLSLLDRISGLLSSISIDNLQLPENDEGVRLAQTAMSDIQLRILAIREKRDKSYTASTSTKQVQTADQAKYKRALLSLQSSILPVRAQGIAMLRDLVLSRSSILTNEMYEDIFARFAKLLQEEDSFIYLNTIKALAALTDVHGMRFIPQIVALYADNSADFDRRLRSGESILLTQQRAGEALAKYTHLITPQLLKMIGEHSTDINAEDEKDKEALLHMSALSIVGAMLETSVVSQLPWMSTILSACSSLLTIETRAELRRSAVGVLVAYIRGVSSRNEQIGQLDGDSLRQVYRLLKIASNIANEPDELARSNARSGLAMFDDLIKSAAMPIQTHPLITVVN